MRASATCETGREGKGLTSTSEPVRASRSSCQPGKVARRMKVMKARIMATILEALSHQSNPRQDARVGEEQTYIK